MGESKTSPPATPLWCLGECEDVRRDWQAVWLVPAVGIMSCHFLLTAQPSLNDSSNICIAACAESVCVGVCTALDPLTNVINHTYSQAPFKPHRHTLLCPRANSNLKLQVCVILTLPLQWLREASYVTDDYSDCYYNRYNDDSPVFLWGECFMITIVLFSWKNCS